MIMSIEDCLTHIAFMIPKVHEVRKGHREKVVTINNIIDLTLVLVNQAYKLVNVADRFYVLLLAFRKFVQCSLNLTLDGNPSDIFYMYNVQWFVALWNDTPVDMIPSQYKEELSLTLIEATLQVREDLLRTNDDAK